MQKQKMRASLRAAILPALGWLVRFLLVTAYLDGLVYAWLAIGRAYGSWTKPVPLLALDTAALVIAVAWVVVSRWSGMVLATLTLFGLAWALERLPRAALATLPVAAWGAAMFYTTLRFKLSESGAMPGLAQHTTEIHTCLGAEGMDGGRESMHSESTRKSRIIQGMNRRKS